MKKKEIQHTDSYTISCIFSVIHIFEELSFKIQRLRHPKYQTTLINICKDLVDKVENMLSKLPIARETRVKEGPDDN